MAAELAINEVLLASKVESQPSRGKLQALFRLLIRESSMRKLYERGCHDPFAGVSGASIGVSVMSNPA